MTRNPSGQIQRQHVIDRGDALVVKANLVAVAHGLLRPDGEPEPASLIVTDFTFLPTGTSRRFVSAVISYSFASKKSTDSGGPVVFDIAPKGNFSINPPETTKVTGSPALSTAQEGDAKLNFGNEISWALVENRKTTGHATLTGSTRAETHDDDTARWTLMEDDTKDKGIPNFFRTVILLSRKNNEPFQAIVDIKTSSDWLSTVESTVGQISSRQARNDPVIFDPSLPPVARTDNLLAEINLKHLENPVWKRLGAVASTREALSEATNGESSFQIPQIPAGRDTASFR